MARHGDIDDVITTWLHGDAVPGDPSYLHETLELLERTARPRWHGPWQRLIAFEPPLVAVPRPLLQLGILGLLLLAVIGAALIVGAQRNPAPPVGLARNGQVAYSDGRTLFLHEVDGNRVQTGLVGMGYETNPAISPDGTRIAWLSRERPELGAQRLYAAPLDGSAPPVEITSGIPAWNLLDTDVPPGWSPDGTRLVYTGLDIATGAVGIVVARVDGTGSNFVATGEAWSDYRYPRWSPDGQWISFSAMDGFVLDGTRLEVARPDGSELTELIRADVRSESFVHLSWSPDSSRIVYARRDSATPGEYRVAMLDVATGVETPLNPNGTFGFYPAWSSDGRSIAYLQTTSPTAPAHTIVVDVSGASPPRDLGPVIDCVLAWSPDSRFLIGHSPDTAGCTDAYVVVPVDDPEARTLLRAPGAEGQPSWQRMAP